MISVRSRNCHAFYVMFRQCESEEHTFKNEAFSKHTIYAYIDISLTYIKTHNL